MKILHVITRANLGGAQTVVLSLANAICNQHQVIVAGEEEGPMWDLLDPRIEKVRIKEIVREISFKNDIIAYFKLKKLYHRVHPDVIHLHSSKAGALGRLAFPSRKIVYSVHGFDSIRLAYRKFLFVEKLLKNRCKAIVLASDYDKQNIIREGISSKLHIVYNGLNEPVIEPGLFIEGVERFEKKVLCIARISPQKRFDSFVELARLLPEYAFIWIGAEANYEYEKLQNLFVLEAIPNANRYIQLADIFVLPSNYEGVPIAIVAAISYGIPIVSSNVGGISEIVRNNQNGFTLPNNNLLFAQKISYILRNDDVCRLYSLKARQIFSESLTISKMVEGYMNIYNSDLACCER